MRPGSSATVECEARVGRVECEARIRRRHTVYLTTREPVVASYLILPVVLGLVF